jgi:transcriptional regulator GlxA family with amidase domain
MARRPPVARRRTLPTPGPRRVVMLAFPDAQILDVAGPLEVFAIATRLLRATAATAIGRDAAAARRDPGYAVEVVAARSGPVRMSSGIELVAARALRDVRGPLDTLLVAGGEGVRRVRDEATIEWIRRAHTRSRRTASVCTGAFLLARAGLLDGRRATTHWGSCDALARRFPKIRVEPDRIYVRDGRIATSAGVTAGMDLALALVEEDLGAALARDVARQMVLFLRRPGGQSQFSAQLAAPPAGRPSLRDLQSWIHEHPDADLGVDALARRMGMSPRHFARVFADELGITPARYVERSRVEAARQRLEDSRAGLEEVAQACGFGSAETMRRAFQRQLRVSPASYRHTFARTGRTGEEVRA